VRKAIGEPDLYDSGIAIQRAKMLPWRIFTLYVVLYGVGSLFVTAGANALAHLPLTENMAAIVIAAVVGGCVDGTLNFFSAEVLSAHIIALISEAHRTRVALSESARGGIGRRVIAALFVVIGVTAVAMGGASIHLLTEIAAGTIKAQDALRLGEIYTGGALAVAVMFAALATSLLSKGIARPILHTVELMDRLREGDLLRGRELYSEPLFAHEAGLLIFPKRTRGLRGWQPAARNLLRAI
jgi:hypothetical protein